MRVMKLCVLWLLMVAAFTMMLKGCSSIAQLIESEVPAVVEPDTAVLEQDHCALTYRWCVYGVCVDRRSEVTKFGLELDDGSLIECTAVYLEVKWPDGSRNQWLWPGLDSDPKCEAEMERLAATPLNQGVK